MDVFDLFAKISIDTSEYDRGINNISKKGATAKEVIVKIGGAFKAADNALDVLSEAFHKSTKEIGRNNAASETAKNKFGVLVERYNQAQAEVERLTEAFNKSSKESGFASKETQRLADELAEAERQASSLKNAQDEMEGWGGELKDWDDELEDVADNLDAAGKGAADFGDVLKANLLSDAIMAGMRKLGNLFSAFSSGMIEQAASLQAQEAQFSQSFGAMEKQARSSLKAVADEAGIAATRIQGSYTQIFAFAKTAGADSAEALTIAQRAMVAAADSAAYYDRSIEDVTETLQSFLKGNYANDAALGIAATETTRNAKANELYAQSFDKLSESQKVDVLLAMVEAGNRASGAIGQAARESDAWENVTGELTESWRMLQSTVGKPVLQKTIPVLQKITASLKAAAESKKFEQFAEGLGNTLGWLVDNGGKVVSATASVGAGILSMKVALNAASYVEKFTGALNAMKLAMAANPWALAIGGVTTLITLLATMPKHMDENEKRIHASVTEIEADVSRLRESAEDLNATFQEIDVDFSATRNELDGTIVIAEKYLNKLEELENQDALSEQAQSEYNKTVELLKTLLPDVNIRIDEQTGLLQGGTKALRGNISAWKDMAVAQAYQKKLQKSTEALVDAQETYLESQRKLKEIAPRVASLYAQLTSWQYQMDSGAISLAEYRYQVDQINMELNGLLPQMEILRGTMSDSEAVIDTNSAKLDEYAEKAGLAASGTEKLSGAIADADAQTFLNLQKAYSDLKNAARESVDSQVGAFDELSMKTDWTFDKILQNLESQNRAFSQYSDNLKKAMERGIDEGVIQTLSDGSEESMRILDVLVNGTDEEIDRLADMMQLNREQRNRLAASIADATKSADAEWRNAAKDAENAGMDIVNGAISGIKKKTQEYLAAVNGLAAAGQRQYRITNEIKSPSRKFRRLAEYDVDGLIAGWKEKAAALQRTVSFVAGSMIDPLSKAAITLPKGFGVESKIEKSIVSHGQGNSLASGNVTYLQPVININGAQYKDEERLVQRMSQELAALTQRRSAIYANGL